MILNKDISLRTCYSTFDKEHQVRVYNKGNRVLTIPANTQQEAIYKLSKRQKEIIRFLTRLDGEPYTISEIKKLIKSTLGE